MDFATMETQVYAVLSDTAKQFVLTSEVKAWLNEGNIILAKRLRALRAKTSGTTGANAETQALPADFLEALTFKVATEFVEFVPDAYFSVRFQIGGTPSPRLARVYGNVIEMNPVANTLAYELRYIKKPASMVNGTDVSDLPESLHDKVVNYARAHAKYKDSERDEGDRYMAMFEAGLPPAGAENLFSPFAPLQPPAWIHATES